MTQHWESASKALVDAEDRRTWTAYCRATGESLSYPEYLELRRAWREMGGAFCGPNVETATMAETKLLPLLRRLRAVQEFISLEGPLR